MSLKTNRSNYYKVVLLGDGRVGKTSILLRFIENSYVEGRSSTFQAAYFDKTIVIDEGDGNDEHNNCRTYSSPSYDQQRSYTSNNNHLAPRRREAQLSIWDTAGQERFHSLGPIYYRDASGAILVYDITDVSSFDRMKAWAKELRKMVGDSSKICLFIVGNKIDLERHNRAVENEVARRYAVSVGADFLEVSAKTGVGVEDVFVELTRKMMDTVKPSLKSKSSLANAPVEMAVKDDNGTSNARIKLTEGQSISEPSRCC